MHNWRFYYVKQHFRLHYIIIFKWHYNAFLEYDGFFNNHLFVWLKKKNWLTIKEFYNIQRKPQFVNFFSQKKNVTFAKWQSFLSNQMLTSLYLGFQNFNRFEGSLHWAPLHGVFVKCVNSTPKWNEKP